MKNKILLIVMSVFVQLNVSNAQSPGNHFGLNDFAIDSAVRYIHASTITRDGGMLLLTGNEYRNSISPGDYGFSLTRFDVSGTKLWNTFIYGEASFSVNYQGIIETPDNGFAIIANTTFNGGGFILKTDASGNFVFMQRYARQILNYSLDASDNGFLLVTNAGNTYSEIIKTDSLGNIVWSDSKDYSVDPDHYYAAKKLSNGNYLAVGVAYSNPSISNGVGIVTCYTPTGTVLWSQSYQGPEWVTSFSNFNELADGNILLVGNANTIGVSGSRGIAAKIDASGNFLWSKSADLGLAINFTGFEFSDDAVYAAGNYDQPNNVTLPVVLKLDTGARFQWMHIFSEPSSTSDITFGSSGKFTIDHAHLGFNNYRTFCNTDTALTGSCYLYDSSFVINPTNMTQINTTSTLATVAATPTSLTRTNSGNINFVKFDACIFTGIDIPATSNSSIISIYPNPSQEFFNVNIENVDQSNFMNLVLINNLGQSIKQFILRNGFNSIETNGISPGIYFYRILDQNSVLKIGKVIIQ